MSRSGYIDDMEDMWALIRWRGAVRSAIRGARGQAMLKGLRDALDSMPEKRLIADELVDSDGECCALGRLAQVQGVNIESVVLDDSEELANLFNVAEALVREIVYENDEGAYEETPEQRWQRMRRWVESHIQDDRK